MKIMRVRQPDDTFVDIPLGYSAKGEAGKSAYEIALDNGFEGSEEEWLESLKGRGISKAYVNTDGYLCIEYTDNTAKMDGTVSLKGKAGRGIQKAEITEDGCLQIYYTDGSVYTSDEPIVGTDGKSAYELACDNGFEGTEQEWLESLKGADGKDGTSITVTDVVEKISTASGGLNETTITFSDGQTAKISAYNGKDGYNGSDGNGVKNITIDEDGYMMIEYTEEEGIVLPVSLKGANGKSAYEIALDTGFEGSEEEWLESLKGSSVTVTDIKQDISTVSGGLNKTTATLSDGQTIVISAYNGKDGRTGTNGGDGADGLSAYQIAVLFNGFEGTEEEWLETLKGANGKSAYQYAVDGGYTGTEEEFAEKLANGNTKDNSMLITFTMSEDGEVFADKTIQECLEVYNKGGEVKAILNGLDEHYKGRLAFVESYEDEPTQIASVVFMLDSILDFTNKMKIYALADDNFEYFYQQKKTLVAWDELPVYNGEVIE